MKTDFQLLDSLGKVRSPCISWCQMDAKLPWCQGCARSLDEIASWGSASEEAKLKIWQQLQERHVQLDSQLDSQ